MKLRRICALVLLALVLVPGTALGHAQVRRSEPADGARLETYPRVLTIEFTEPPDPAFTDVSVIDQNGEVHEAGGIRIDGTALVAALPALTDGAYSATWSTISTADGHPSSGTIRFAVGQAPLPEPVPTETTPGPTPLSVVGRLLLYAGLVLLTGAAAWMLLVGRRAPNPRSQATALGLGAIGVAGGVWFSSSSAAAVADAGVIEYLSSAAGRPLLLQCVGALACIAAAVVGSLRPGPPAGIGCAVAAGGTMLMHALGSHAAAAGGGAPVVIQWIHMLAATTWIGGLVWVLLGRGGPREVRALSRLAAVCLALIAITGVARALSMLNGQVGDLGTTSYGRLVLVKVFLFACLASVGAWNRWGNLRREPIPIARVRRAIFVEVAIAVVAFGTTAFLSQTPPPAPPPQPTAEIVTEAGTVELRIEPAAVGTNTYRVELPDEGATGVQLTLRPMDVTAPPATVRLADQDGAWVGSGEELSIAGTWEVTLLVQLPSTSYGGTATIQVSGPASGHQHG